MVTAVSDHRLFFSLSIFRIMNIGESNMDSYEIQSNLLKALSHSTRLAILDIYGMGNNVFAISKPL